MESAPLTRRWRAGSALAVLTIAGLLASCANTKTLNGKKPFAEETVDQLFGLASYMETNGERAAAAAVYERIIEDERATVDTLDQAANRLEAANAFIPAVRAYERIIEIDPDHDEALASHGKLLVRLGRLKEAIHSFERWVKMEKRNANAYLHLAASLDFAGRHEEAEAIYQTGLDKAGDDNPDLSLNYAVSLALTGRFEQAIERARTTLENAEVDQRHLRNAVLILALAGKSDDARTQGLALGSFQTDLILDQAMHLNKLETSAARARSLGGVGVSQ